MPHLRPRCLGQRPGMDPGRDLAPLAMGAVSRFELRGDTIYRLDAELRRTDARNVQLDSPARLLAVTPDLSCFVATTDESTLVCTETALRHHRLPADSATFLRADRVLVTAPLPRTVTDNRADGGAHAVLLFDSTTGEIVDSARLEVFYADVSALAHPSDGSVILDAGEGQDGSQVFLVRVVNDEITAERVLANVAASGFSSSGDRLLLTPHPNFENRATVLSWPERSPLASISGDDLDLDGDRLQFYGCFVGPERVLLQTYEHGLLLCDSELAPIGSVDLGDYGKRAGWELEAVYGLSDTTFATTVWKDGRTAVVIWQTS